MEKNTQILIALLILIIGFGAGYTMRDVRGGVGQEASSRMMQNGSMMGDNSMNGGMGSVMDDMTAGLQGKTGDAFDRAFLSEMIVHHQGAVAMAQAALQSAKHQEIKDMAKAIISAQTTEINQMKAWEKSWYNQ